MTRKGSLKIRKKKIRARKCTHEQWMDFVNKDDTSTFFHHPEWYKVWSDTNGYIVEPEILELSSGKRVCLPLAYKYNKRALSRIYISSPGGTFGGCLAKVPLTAPEELEYLAYLKSISGYIVDSPHRERSTPIDESEKFTQVVDLLKASPGTYQNWSKGHKSAAKRALREGVEILLAETKEDWNNYYQIYLASIKRWGDDATFCYPRSFFERIAQLDSMYYKLWLAKYNGRVITGCLCFYHKFHVAYWHGAADSSYFKLGAVHALQREIMIDAKMKGMKLYDFNPSNGLEGVMKFKKGFDTEVVPYLDYKNSSLVGKVKGRIFKFISK